MISRISTHITWEEATKSATALRLGIANVPTPEIIAKMQRTAQAIFEPARGHFGPLAVTSFYRSPELNAAVGGSPHSQHMSGEAIDIDGDPFGLSNEELLRWVVHVLPYDQVIWEFGAETPAWVHVSYRGTGGRKEVLRAVREGGETIYRPLAL